ncbi:LLM class flavin-dependent oxidoreductase, partial [Streptomyces sp. NPDC052610]|uniref:LLM class flavin-dependent oxidoreductase n=1 Tax=Streptomyces sp. NPDC052610 TaxID=3154952 RepID=UPI00344A3564
MAIGVTLDATGSDNQIDASVRLARQAAEAGLGSAWFGQTFGADSPLLAAIVGREVPGLHVGTSAIPVFGRHPLLVSSQAQTAQAATHGRYHLGLALGTKLLTEAGFGIPSPRPVALLREFLTALRQLTEIGSADFHGELLTAATPIPARVPGAEGGVP